MAFFARPENHELLKEMDRKDFLTYYACLLRRRKWLLGAILGVFTCTGVLLSIVVPPRYTATARLIVTSVEKEPIQIPSAVKSPPATPADWHRSLQDN